MSTTRRSTSSQIEIINRQRSRKIDRDRAAALSRAVLDLIGRTDAALTVTFIRDRAMRRLNRDYRGIDGPTDVLSFAYHEGEEAPACDETRHIGDGVISFETAGRYASRVGLSCNRK